MEDFKGKISGKTIHISLLTKPKLYFMSHEKVKSIKIENGEVLITSKCNNDTEPVKQWHCTSLTEVLKQQGGTALTIEILKAYEEGNFQPGTPNKYSRAIDRIRYLPEYQKYNWRNKYNWDKDKDAEIEANRQSEAFNELLLNSLNLNPPKSKMILTKETSEGTVYLLKVTTRTARWTWKRSEAKVFNYEQDTQRVRNMLVGGENFKTITL